MKNEQSTDVQPATLSTAAPIDLERELLGTGLQPGGQETPPTAAGAGSGTTQPEPATPAPAVTPREPVTEYRVNFPKEIYPKHRTIYEEIRDLPGNEQVERLKKIEHVSRGLQRGCICFKCEVERSQIFELQVEAPASEAPLEVADTFLSEFLDEELVGDLATLPKQIVQVTLEMKDFPPKAIQAWETSQRRLALYQKYGKRVLDRYAKIPDFKHKELIALLVLGMIDYAQATHQTILAIRLQKATNEQRK